MGKPLNYYSLEPALENDREFAINLPQSLILVVHFLVILQVAKNRDFINALSDGNTGRPALIRRYWLFRLSIALVIYSPFLTFIENLKIGQMLES